MKILRNIGIFTIGAIAGTAAIFALVAVLYFAGAHGLATMAASMILIVPIGCGAFALREFNRKRALPENPNEDNEKRSD
jgi:hypothetical protein